MESCMVKAIMNNERRWGDLEVRRRVVIDYKEKVTAKNDGIREGAYIPGYHEGIVSPEIAKAAHMMRASRYKFGSVPDVCVINEGALKGFVSISPTWRGIDNQAFQDISRQVYEDGEFEELLHEAAILNGNEHSNVISMTLNDYRVAPGVMFMCRSDPQLTISQRDLVLNGACKERLGNERYVEFLYHPILEVIAVRSAYATNPNAVKWDDSKASSMRISSNAFSGAIFDKLDWMRKYKFRFRGITRVRDGEKIVFFFLDEPQILVGKKAKELLEADTSDGTAKFIPYKESDPRNIALQPTGVAYPEDWQNIVGVSYEIKQKRAGVLDAVSAADICNCGKKVINPFIGVIPPMSELEDEVERIYEAM
jgi:site-specific DNA recombinase